jgi:membrane fusion protein (multidrug efflux system)
VVRQGDIVGVVLPTGTLHVVAAFAPAAALGRVRAGQTARLRLEGFPWAQYGSLPATVTKVADEVRDGSVRVDLALLTDVPTNIPLQHGLPGSVEVVVDQVSPLTLLLRSVGKRFGVASPPDKLVVPGSP